MATDLAGILALPDEAAFQARFAFTPMLRAKRRGMMRNACVAAGNSGDQTLVAPLRSLLAREQDPLLREHAEWALAELTRGR